MFYEYLYVLLDSEKLKIDTMGHFSVRVMNDNGKPASDVGVMIDYGIMNGTDDKQTMMTDANLGNFAQLVL